MLALWVAILNGFETVMSGLRYGTSGDFGTSSLTSPICEELLRHSQPPYAYPCAMLTIALIEDEPLARTRVKTLLEEIENVRLVGEASTRAEGLQLLLDQKPDVALLDVQLPDGSGFELAEALPPDAMPLLIFLTAFDQYAVRAFDVAAVDYVLKPIRPERLHDAIERAREMVRPRTAAAPADHVVAARPRRIAVTTEDDTLLLVYVSDIDYIEAAGNYVRLHWSGKHQLFRESIGALEEKLDPEQFARIHRSVIVNLDRVERLEPNAFGDYRVTLRGGTTVPMSRRYRERISLLVGRL
jgi:two-component system LytT family response regulator